MSRAVRKSVRKYLKIKAMFMCENPDAQRKWELYAVAENGLGIAIPWINKGVRV